MEEVFGPIELELLKKGVLTRVNFGLLTGPGVRAAFLDEVHGARAEGFFSFESIADSFTHCFAAPVYQDGDICVATLCLIAPRDDAMQHHARYREVLVACAAELTEKLTSAPKGLSVAGIV